MLDMIYINDRTKNFIHFRLEGQSFNELCLQVNDRKKVTEEIGKYFESIIKQFGQTVDIPEVLLESLNEDELDKLLVKLHTDQKTLFMEHFFAIVPPQMMRNFTDTETLRIYSTLGINRYAVLIKCDNEDTTHLAAAEHEEFRERFILTGKGNR